MPASSLKIVTTAAVELLSFNLRRSWNTTAPTSSCLGSDRHIRGKSRSKRGQIACSKDRHEGYDGNASLWEKGAAVPSWGWEDLGKIFMERAPQLSLSMKISIRSIFSQVSKGRQPRFFVLSLEIEMPALQLEYGDRVSDGVCAHSGCSRHGAAWTRLNPRSCCFYSDSSRKGTERRIAVRRRNKPGQTLYPRPRSLHSCEIAKWTNLHSINLTLTSAGSWRKSFRRSSWHWV